MSDTANKRRFRDTEDLGFRQRTKQFLSVDFVTATPLDECIELLKCCDEDMNQTVTIAEDGSFSLQRTFVDDDTEISFWGTLETVDRGTWVWGTIFEERSEGWHSQDWIPAFIVIVTLFMVLEAILSDAFTQAAIWLGILLTFGLIALLRWRWRYRHGLMVVEWVYELLYVRPVSEKKSAPKS
jgi:hypothetical protein